MKEVDNMFQVCYKNRFHVVKLCCNKQFEHIVDEWRAKQDPIVNANYFNAGEHVLSPERNNRTTQERARTSYYQMPHNHLPRKIV